MPALSETCVWFLRHGESTFNVEHRCQGSCDEPELTARGRETACLSGERLAAEGIQTIISSPLGRAAHTADEVLKIVRARGQRVTFETDDRLREIGLYNWEGLHFEKISRYFPEQYGTWRLRPQEFHMWLAEDEVQYPVRNLYDRARSFWDDLLTSYAGKSILLISHGGTIRALTTLALGLGPEHFQRFQQSNCGVSRVRFANGSAPARLELLNDTAHLRQQLPKLKEGRQGARLLLIPVEEPNPEAVRCLAFGLEGVVIDHLLAVGAAARSATNQFLSSRSDSCQMFSEITDAEAAVEQALYRSSPGQLCHIAILGPQLALRSVLRRQLGISLEAAESLDLRPFQTTSVHCPLNGTPPVLQALNILKPILSLAEVQP